MMPNSYPKWENFQCAQNNHYGFFFLQTLPSTFAVTLKIHYSFNLMLKYLHSWSKIGQEKFSTAATYDVDVEKFG